MSPVDKQTTRPATGTAGPLDSWFKISERGSTVGREVRGGIVTFLTMAYILVLNPIILTGGADLNGDKLAGGDVAAVAAATALVAGVLTMLMGAVANYPMALAAGLGLNAFVTYSIASQMTWADAMGLVVMEGLIILLLVLTGFREAVFKAVPGQLKVAISVGIGLFITLIGLVDSGFVRKTAGSVPVEMGIGGQLQGWPVLVFVIGLALVIGLYVAHVRGAILISILTTTVLAIIVEKLADVGPTFGADGTVNPKGWNLNVPALPDEVVQLPDLGLVGEFSLLGSWENAGIVTVALLIFTLLLADFFDTMGTMTAIGAEGGLLDEEGNPPNTKRILIVDSLAAAAGGAASVSSNTSYIESTSGVAEGARTGLSSVVTGLLFLLAMFFAPVVRVVPNEAAVPALVLVGFLMMQQVRGIDWDDLEIAIPAFLTIVVMPFTYSISAGIGAGFLAYVLIKVVRGKIGQVHALMWIIAVLFLIYFAISPISSWVG
ncbi:NCS2 family permease [Myroides odoratimimus subsp. xuanwuensis]